jgi:hypothetical protein
VHVDDVRAERGERALGGERLERLLVRGVDVRAARPEPGVEKTTPRARPAAAPLKKLPANRFGALEPSGTPSQLISRRPVKNVPGWLGFSAPRLARYESSTGVSPAASWEAPENVTWACVTPAHAPIASAAAKIDRERCMILSSVGNGVCGRVVLSPPLPLSHAPRAIP